MSTSGYAACARNNSWDQELLHDYQCGEHKRQDDAMHECAGEDRAFLTLQLGQRGAGGKILRRNHFAHDAARRVGRGEQYRVEVEWFRPGSESTW